MEGVSDHSRISIPRAETEKIVIPKIRGKSGKILEVGCSAAIYRNTFHGDYIGLDLSDLEFPKTDKKHNFLVGTGYNLPFKDRTFDFVLCLAVLEHVKYPDKFVKEISRVLKIQGEALINSATPIGMIYESYPKYKGFRHKALVELLFENSLQPIWSFQVGGPLAQFIAVIESVTKVLILGKKSRKLDTDRTQEWCPYITAMPSDRISNVILKLRSVAVDLISQIEIRTRLCNICSLGVHILTKKRSETWKANKHCGQYDGSRGILWEGYKQDEFKRAR